MEGNNFVYPVNDISKIKGAKYRKDFKECVCMYTEQIVGEGIEEITETQYNTYPNCRINVNKQQIQGDGIDIAKITVILPSSIADEQVNLFVDGELIDFALTDTNKVIFELVADETMLGDILEITAESTHWKRSEKVLLEVI
jgi:hypothetical protein